MFKQAHIEKVRGNFVFSHSDTQKSDVQLIGLASLHFTSEIFLFAYGSFYI